MTCKCKGCRYAGQLAQHGKVPIELHGDASNDGRAAEMQTILPRWSQPKRL
jgi:hypothetical protein